MSDYGLKVSNAGQDVGTATDRDLQFTTDYSTLKFYQAGTARVTSGNGTITIPHNLGFAPAFYVWRKTTAQNTFLSGGTTYPNSYIPVGVPNSWDNLGFSSKVSSGYIHAFSDNTNLNIAVSGAAAGTYDFKYYTLVDLANDYSGTSITKSGYGFKASKPGIDVTTAKEYELCYSSEYKALQYYDVSSSTSSLSMPNATASLMSTEVQGGDFVDFNHGLGYQPFYLAYYSIYPSTGSAAEHYEIPDFSLSRTTGQNFEMISSFCDSTKVRISWWKMAYFNALEESVNDLGGTLNIKLMVFTENLSNTTL